jgi:hypothetical protein
MYSLESGESFMKSVMLTKPICFVIAFHHHNLVDSNSLEVLSSSQLKKQLPSY